MLHTKDEVLAITTIEGGAVLSRSQFELNKIMDNIIDPNTTLDKRRLNIIIDFKPNADRDMMDIKIDCHSILAKDQPILSKALIGTDLTGKAQAHELVTQEQPELPYNVTSFEKGASK